ncbi:hypothetical protein [Ammoniphilus resinae]|nr:hypothetical protein [Ammoniphilus resinae]
MKNSVEDPHLLLGKEFWGILFFEMNLPSLHEFLQVNKKGIGLKRFGDWVLFPDKIPVEFQKQFLHQLENRYQSSDYPSIYDRKMIENEEKFHLLIQELLQIKYAGSSICPQSLPSVLGLSTDAFMAIFFQFVERGYLTANDVLHQWYPHFKRDREVPY